MKYLALSITIGFHLAASLISAFYLEAMVVAGIELTIAAFTTLVLVSVAVDRRN